EEKVIVGGQDVHVEECPVFNKIRKCSNRLGMVMDNDILLFLFPDDCFFTIQSELHTVYSLCCRYILLGRYGNDWVYFHVQGLWEQLVEIPCSVQETDAA